MIEQLAIGFFGIASIWLSQDRSHARRKWACVFGICAQPFWLYATVTAQQWGIFVLTLVYTIGWARGIYNFWIVGRSA